MLWNVAKICLKKANTRLFILVPSTGCDAISSRGSCFSYFSTSAILWSNARTACIAWGGNLATIPSAADNALILTTSTSGTTCLIGINDINTEGVYVWADGSTSTYRNWRAGEPNDNGGSEDCASFHADGKWNDINCNRNENCYYCSVRGKKCL